MVARPIRPLDPPERRRGRSGLWVVGCYTTTRCCPDRSKGYLGRTASLKSWDGIFLTPQARHFASRRIRSRRPIRHGRSVRVVACSFLLEEKMVWFALLLALI